MSQKFCVDCRHFDGSRGHRCHGILSSHPVLGQSPTDPNIERQYNGTCGPKAIYFEPKLTLLEKLCQLILIR